jgi:hypothetical protein
MDRAERRSRTRNFIDAQMRIARRSSPTSLVVTQPGRLKKQHAMDCGRPQCGLCGNPRKAGHKNPETMQELRSHDRMAAGLDDVFADNEELSPA